MPSVAAVYALGGAVTGPVRGNRQIRLRRRPLVGLGSVPGEGRLPQRARVLGPGPTVLLREPHDREQTEREAVQREWQERSCCEVAGQEADRQVGGQACGEASGEDLGTDPVTIRT